MDKKERERDKEGSSSILYPHMLTWGGVITLEVSSLRV